MGQCLCRCVFVVDLRIYASKIVRNVKGIWGTVKWFLYKVRNIVRNVRGILGGRAVICLCVWVSDTSRDKCKNYKRNMSALGVLLNESKIVRLKRNKTAIGENCKNCKRNFKGGGQSCICLCDLDINCEKFGLGSGMWVC